MIISNIKNLILRKHSVMSFLANEKAYIENKVKACSHASLRLQCFTMPTC